MNVNENGTIVWQGKYPSYDSNYDDDSLNYLQNKIYWLSIDSNVAMYIGAINASTGNFIFQASIQALFTNLDYHKYKIMEHGGNILFISTWREHGQIVILNSTNQITSVKHVSHADDRYLTEWRCTV